MYDRLVSTTYTDESGYSNSVTYTYQSVNGNTTSVPQSYSSTVGTTTTASTYTYDERGNITKIVTNGDIETRYYYDVLNRLIREDNEALNKTYQYTYDNGGNR